MPRNRRPDEVNKRFTNDAHPDRHTAARRLDYDESDRVLMLPVSVAVEGSPRPWYRQSSGSYVCSLAPPNAEGPLGYRKAEDGSMFTPRALGSGAVPSERALESQGIGSSTPNCWELFRACKTGHGRCG